MKGRRLLAGFWVLYTLWLVLRPVPVGDSGFSQEARLTYATLLLGMLWLLAYTLFRTSRWPVTVSRILMAALIAGTAIGPAGRPTWAWAVDAVIAAAGSAIAFFMIRQPPPSTTARDAQRHRKRIDRRSERVREGIRRSRRH